MFDKIKTVGTKALESGMVKKVAGIGGVLIGLACIFSKGRDDQDVEDVAEDEEEIVIEEEDEETSESEE